MNILLLSAYDADSHRRWHRGLEAAFPHWQWTVLTLPPRHFSWRVRGNSLSWAWQQRSLLQQPYDLLVVTSMTDLSALRGFVPALARLPTLVYFHENQFAYPTSAQAHRSVEPQVLNLYTALCADRIAFNSEYNCRTFLDGVAGLLRRLPDQVPPGLVEQLQQRSAVLPVPLENGCFIERAGQGDGTDLWPLTEDGKRPLRLLWAARWEYDKGPQLLLEILRHLRQQQRPFQLCLLGQSFRQVPAEFEHIRQEFSRQLVHCGFEPDRQRYQRWLATADRVLSTARHEFQGLAVLEAIAAGCVPVVPDNLSYPELVPAVFRYDVSGETIAVQARAAVGSLMALADNQPPPDVSAWSWRALEPGYRQLLEGLVRR